MTDKDNSARIENVLKQVRLLKDKHEKLAEITGESFNVFSVLGVETKEVKTHSSILAELLNPKGSHRQGTVFLKHFLNLMSSDLSNHGNLEDFWVGAEVFSKYGKIDILLEKKDDACIIIENKINAGDQDSQLNRYYMYAKERFTDERIKLIYLTLDGREPSEKSLAGQGTLDKSRVICMSYHSDIVAWLEDCFKEVVRVAPIREILFQYQALARKLTGQSTNGDFFMDNIVELLTKEYDLIPELEKSIPETKSTHTRQILGEVEKTDHH